jgi:AmpD protein
MNKPESSHMKSQLLIHDGWIAQTEKCLSSHFDVREHCTNKEISLLVIHNISLPAKQFGGQYITDLFMGCLDANAHPSFEELYQLRVSAHCLIRRDGHIIQYVSFNDRAWHAGVSSYKGREKCNDFSIGIELEGADDIPYTEEQYQILSRLTTELIKQYPLLANNIVGHNDIAPGRKTDPGESFNWQRFTTLLNS